MKRLLLVILFFILIVFWWLFVYSSISNYILFYKANINTLNNQKKKCLECKFNFDFFSKEIQNLNQNFNNNLDNNLAKIINLISKNKLDLESCCDKKTIKDNIYCKIPFEFIFSGKFCNIMNFFNDLSDLYSFIEFESFNLKKIKSNNLLCNFSISFLLLNN